ncbi:hypothetical protein AVEN_270053-1 [Araneus ventricosus]|uniref:Uncharacterized protein n=1 Tax=Araneus ventricosus TaxID=182803 RepID=A0A4Y2LG23_ARAVE|nr:hypothetical protein AVEN_270053-1 [Araneus ventricosus]
MHLPDTETNDSEILPRRRKRAVRLISDSTECSRVVDTSSEEWIWKEIDKTPVISLFQSEIKKFTGVPDVNAPILPKIGANPKSLEVFKEVLNMNFWEILSTETNRHAEQEMNKIDCPSKNLEHHSLRTIKVLL